MLRDQSALLKSWKTVMRITESPGAAVGPCPALGRTDLGENRENPVEFWSQECHQATWLSEDTPQCQSHIPKPGLPTALETHP